MAESDILILIPARMASTRLPGKPLADIAGQPMIVQVLRRAQEAALGPVAVATDSPEIAATVEKAGGEAVMTRADHATGSDRIFEALTMLDPQGRAGIVINLQGDLPTLAPADLRAVLKPFDDPQVDIATLGAVIKDKRDYDNPNIVKVSGTAIAPRHLRAVSFSRTAPAGNATAYHHIGLYAYRRAALERFVKLPPSASEQREKLEQLRAMDAGMRIDVILVESVPLGVDTPEDLAQARAALSSSAAH